MVEEAPETSRSLIDALASLIRGDLSQTPVARLSDLSRAEARILARAWGTIPEETRADLVRRFDELSEERIDVNFRRALRVALDDPSPMVRQLAIGGLWEDESTELLDLLLGILKGDPSPDVRATAAGALERFAGKAVHGELDAETSTTLRQMLLGVARNTSDQYGVQRKALESLGPYGNDQDIANFIAEAYASGDHGLQCSALYAMGRSLQPRWLQTILQELESDEAELRYEAVRAAGALGSTDALPALLEAARDDDVEVRQAAIRAIGAIGGRGAVRALERLAEDAGEADLELITATIEDVNALVEPFPTA